jgi:N-acyl-D-aspartate/D-glutamate deacylase
MSFLTQLPFDQLPYWKEVKALSPEEKLRALRDPEMRRKLVDSAHTAGYGRATGAKALMPTFDRMRVMERPLPPNPTVAEKARQRGVDPVELIIDLAVESSLGQFFLQPIHTDADEVVLPILRHPRTVMTFSDSGAHVSQIMDGSIQTHLLAYWVRERQAFTLEDAVRMITLAPARAWGFSDRGLLRDGMIADINVFDPTIVAPELPTVEHDLPAGAKRLKQQAIGFRATVVGGQIVHLDGEHTGALPGRLLRARH